MQDKNKILQEAIGRVIKKLRKQKNFKFTIFCYENDIATSLLNTIEKGETKTYFSNVARVLKALGLSFEEFGKLLDKELGEDFNNLD